LWQATGDVLRRGGSTEREKLLLHRWGVLLVLGAVALVAACGGHAKSGRSHPASPMTTPETTEGQGVPLKDDLGVFGNAVSFIDHGSFGLDRAQVLPADPGLGQVVRVLYPAGSASNLSANIDGTAYGGAQAYLPLRGGPVDELHLRYYVRFQPGFDFVKGGKLPGLYGGTKTSGRRIPNGTNGFSTRYMWRGGGAGEVYAYLPSSVAHGTSLGRGSWHFVPGQWMCMEQAVQLNTPGQANGSVTVWVNGRQVFQQTDMVYRTSDGLKIDGLFFSTFFGGGDASWASPTDQYAEFAAFVLSSHYIGPLPNPPSAGPDEGPGGPSASPPAR
jgi:hypothetical protein